MGATDIDDDGILRQRFAKEGDIDDKGRAVELLRRAEQIALERMGDHDVIADFDGIHGAPVV
jgi:hypothetical protein